jgi:predicted TPR repeat methyltransferase
MLAAHGMQSFAIEETVIRMDGGKPIVGLLFLARRR